MDNYDLSNLPLLSQSPDSEDYAPWLSEEQNRRATFSGLSATVSTPEQAELQQTSLTHEEQITGQKALADFDISLSANILNPPIVVTLRILLRYLPPTNQSLLTTSHNTPLSVNWA